MTQDEALQLLKLGNNVFLTGSAGSGKTYLLNQYIKYLRQYKVGVSVTASTGLAATHLNGRTIHSWSGIGIREKLSEKDLNKIQRDKRVRKRYLDTKVLIIDEVSMIHAYQLDLIDQVARHLLEPLLPFGGLQLVLCGDFFQLPPVARDTKPEKFFAFDSIAWETAQFCTCYLHEQHRQGNDPLLNVLNDIRGGTTGEHTKVPLRTRYKKQPTGTVQPTRLFARNVNVDSINNQELNALRGTEHVFEMTTQGSEPLVEALIRSCAAPNELKLRVAAKVMFVKNATDGSYVNGTLGTVKSFNIDGMPVVRTYDGAILEVAKDEDWKHEENDKVMATISQVPLKLAWAITVHKSQGMTLDAAEIDLSDAFEPGMGYVALSRVRALSGLNLLGLNETALSVHPQILEKDQGFQNESKLAAQQLATLTLADRSRQQEDILIDRFRGKRQANKPMTNKPIATQLPRNTKASQNTKTRALTQPTDDLAKNTTQQWSDAEDQLMTTLYKDNQTTKAIAKQMQRGHGAVYMRLKKLNLIMPIEKTILPVAKKPPVKKPPAKKTDVDKNLHIEYSLSTTLKETRELLLQRKSIEEIATLRQFTTETIISHIESLKHKNYLPEISYLANNVAKFEEILDLFSQTERQRLSQVYEKLQGKTPYETLRLVRLFSETPNTKKTLTLKPKRT